jgi:hypothetical protein
MTANAGRPDLDQTLRLPTIHAGEPVFILRAQDLLSADVVRHWAAAAFAAGVDPAVVEQALQQADRMDQWSPRKLPDADHLTEDERKQLAYVLSRRAWKSQPARSSAEIILGERRGWDAAMAAVRSRQVP